MFFKLVFYALCAVLGIRIHTAAQKTVTAMTLLHNVDNFEKKIGGNSPHVRLYCGEAALAVLSEAADAYPLHSQIYAEAVRAASMLSGLGVFDFEVVSRLLYKGLKWSNYIDAIYGNLTQLHALRYLMDAQQGKRSDLHKGLALQYLKKAKEIYPLNKQLRDVEEAVNSMLSTGDMLLSQGKETKFTVGGLESLRKDVEKTRARLKKGGEKMALTPLDFAVCYGFDSYEQMLENSELVREQDGVCLYLTELKTGEYILWYDANLCTCDVLTFSSKEDARTFISVAVHSPSETPQKIVLEGMSETEQEQNIVQVEEPPAEEPK